MKFLIFSIFIFSISFSQYHFLNIIYSISFSQYHLLYIETLVRITCLTYMILNVSYNDAKVRQEINSAVGKPFGFIQRIKMKGIGSGRLVIFESTADINRLISKNVDTAYTNIEIRPKGIIVGLKSVGENFSWAIPYYKLSIFKTANYLVIYDGKNKLKAGSTSDTSAMMTFLQKIMSLKDQTSNGLPY